MNKLAWFVVKKAGRIVDCLKAKDVGLAMQAALDVWEKACEKSAHLLEVEPMPDAPVSRVIKPTPSDVKKYGHCGVAGQREVPFVNPAYASLLKASESK
jgi:hypothetical protein